MGDRPVFSKAIPLVGFKFLVVQAQGNATPSVTFAAHLPSACPVKRFMVWGGVGVVSFVYKKIGVGFPVAGVDGLVAMFANGQTVGALGHIPYGLDLIPLWIHIPPSFEDQYPHTAFTQFFGGNATVCTGPHDDRVVGFCGYLNLHLRWAITHQPLLAC